MQLRQFTAALLHSKTLPVVLLLASLYILPFPAYSQDVLTYHNNNARTGVNPNETILTLANVNMANFGKLFTIPTDGLVDAQPLYLSAVTIDGVAHNLVIVATEHGTVYGFDADTGANLWHITTLKAGETTADNRHCDQVDPEIGITSTPVIFRPKNAAPAIYVVAMSKDSNGDYHQRLHALDVTDGHELHNGPVEIKAKYPGTGDNSSGGYVIFDPGQYKERAGLLLIKNTVYLAWASHCDIRPYTGWIMGYDINTLAQTTVLNLTPNGNEGAIWGAGAGMAADTDGNIFVLDANGEFDSNMTASGFPKNGNYGNAFLRITTQGGLAVADYFEMHNQAAENNGDIDLGSGGTLLVNGKDAAGNIIPLAVGAGKDTNLYIVDRTAMGKFAPAANKIYQELPHALPGGVWSMPAMFNGRLYYGPVGSPILAFQFNNAKLMPTPVARTPNHFGYPGATPSISTNAGQNVIVWAAQNSTPATLHAYDAKTLNQLYSSNQAPNGRDHMGPGNKYVTPTIANGKVYVATKNGIGVFGLLK
ncbi:MAG TPA: PQQ-binding-like beta-propeller repeat protein [Candidatus Sulfotelmatobacter sp.]|jgi:outer membrane protein assembly factor BamB|nr:PQQ-binding-like beta-propeller repeat protein [Candidatus Sulfotelmatobacter sp.]